MQSRGHGALRHAIHFHLFVVAFIGAALWTTLAEAQTLRPMGLPAATTDAPPTPDNAPCDSCDTNCDGTQDNLDIAPFISALVQESSGCSPCGGDLNEDSRVDGSDVQKFLDCMMGRTEPGVSIIQNGVLVSTPAFPFQMEAYDDGDLPDLREYAAANGVFAGVNMNADWKDREWEMIKAIQAWLVRNARMSAVGINSKQDLSGRGIAFLSSVSEGGQIVAWGDDDQYGNVSGVADLQPNSGFATVAAGLHHSLALRRTGEIEAWGRNQFGQGAEPDENEGFTAIAAGENHNLALNKAGEIVAWGDNRKGQCDVPEPNADFVAMSAGVEFSVGLRNNGTVVVWGSLGTDALFEEQWQGRFTRIAAGGHHCVGLLDDGTVVAWGANDEGQCEVPTVSGSIPLQDRVIDIGAGNKRSFAKVDFGSGILSWGLPLDTEELPPGYFRSVWPSPANKYLIVSQDDVVSPNIAISGPPIAPDHCQHTALAYDLDRESVVKFGGRRGGSFPMNLRETHEWNGHEWDRNALANAPAARSDHCMAYDARQRRAILWGKASVIGDGRDAWEFDGENWQGPFAASGSARPSAYFGCRAVWDPTRGPDSVGRVSIFFGRNATNVFETAFDYDPVTHTFEQREIGGSPGARYAFGLALDSVRNRIVIFGGANSAGAALQDTREAAAGGTGATTFSLVTPATTTPAARYEHAMVYDAARDRVVMFGGRNGVTYFDETWEWDGVDWTLKSPSTSPGKRAGHAMAYDAEHQVVLLFGGFRNDEAPGTVDDTWEWDGTDWTQTNLTVIPKGMIPDTTSADQTYVGFATGADFGIGLLDYVWSCGSMQQMFSGLCVAHGIPARLISGTSLGCANDVIVEVFSTRWNKWILFWPYTGCWVENADGVPQSQAEMRAHYAAANYRIRPAYERAVGRRGWKATAANNSGLVFKPNGVATAPLAPRAEIEWWSATLKENPVSPTDDHDHFERNFTTSLSMYNSPNPQVNTVLLNDYADVDAICGTNQSSRPMSFDSDLNLTYPLNNVFAEAELVQKSPPRVQINLRHNMLPGTGGFDHYEMSLDLGQTWTMFTLEHLFLGNYNWYPTQTSTIMIRGVNQAGVHSPDVAILYHAGSTGN